MLMSLLPGFRQLRAPIAAGTALVAAFVIAFGPTLQGAADDRLGPGLTIIDDALGRTAWAAVALVVAYLAGGLFVSVVSLGTRELAARMLDWTADPEVLEAKTRALWRVVLAPFSRPSMRRMGHIGRTEYDPNLAYEVGIDVIFGQGKRLMGTNPELFSEYDRLRSESEFRDAIGLPAILLTCAVLHDLGAAPWWFAAGVAFTVVIAALLFLQGRDLERDALSTYAHAVADGMVSTPYLDDPDQRSRRRWRYRGGPPAAP